MPDSIDTWSFPAGLTFALLIVAALYTRGWLELRRAAPTRVASLSIGRAGVFVLGLGVLGLAVALPPGAIGHELLSIHMTRHVLLGTVAPPLIWLSAPVLPILLGLPRWLGRRAHAGIASDALERFGCRVTHPCTAWLAGVLTIVGWHVPAALALAQRSELWHWIQNGSFFVTGLLFWWPVVQPWPAVARLAPAMAPLYLFAATLPCDALSAFLIFCDRVVYRQHADEPWHVHGSALADQQTAGALMWVSITFLYLVPALVMTVHALSPRSPSEKREALHYVNIFRE
jgi:putative membrane protein